MSSSEEEPVVSNEEESEVGSSEEETEEVVVAKPVKTKRVRKTKKGKKKDPNKPKRNMSAFFLYSTAHRKEVKDANPDLSFGDLAKLISKNFKALDDKEKKKWEKKAEKDKARYLAEMKDYVAPDQSDSEESDVDTKKKKKSKKTKDPNKPKRNMSAFFLYSCANRASVKSENPDATFGELAKLVSAQFKALPDKEKKKWEKKAAKDKVRYEEEMKVYNANH